MAGEQARTLPDDLETWVESRAATIGVEPSELLAEAVTLYRLLDADGKTNDGLSPEMVSTRLDELDEQVTDIQSNLDKKVNDVRERVVQVKYETDTKAPADHDHPEIEQDITEALETSKRLTERLNRGFENYEEVLEYLTDETDSHETKLKRLTSMVADLRKRANRAEQALAGKEVVDDIQRAANRHGETKADCGECGATVDIALLNEPNCPHCETGLADLQPGRRFFRSATLIPGTPPALVAGDDPQKTTSRGRSGHE